MIILFFLFLFAVFSIMTIVLAIRQADRKEAALRKQILVQTPARGSIEAVERIREIHVATEPPVRLVQRDRIEYRG